MLIENAINDMTKASFMRLGKNLISGATGTGMLKNIKLSLVLIQINKINFSFFTLLGYYSKWLHCSSY